jgi:AP-3 complex subunit beta
MLKTLLYGTKSNNLQSQAVRLLNAKKPIPSSVSPSEERERFTMGTLSHILSHTVPGYQPIPDWPEQAPHKVSGKNPREPVITIDNFL